MSINLIKINDKNKKTINSCFFEVNIKNVKNKLIYKK